MYLFFVLIFFLYKKIKKNGDRLRLFGDRQRLFGDRLHLTGVLNLKKYFYITSYFIKLKSNQANLCIYHLERPVAVEVDARAARARVGASVLAPETLGGVRVLVAVRVGHRQDVDLVLAEDGHCLGVVGPVLVDEAVDCVDAGGG